MGQAWTTLTNFDEEDEEDAMKQMPHESMVIDGRCGSMVEPEVPLRKCMRVRNWGSSPDLKLVWNKSERLSQEEENPSDFPLADVAFLPDGNIVVSDRKSQTIRLLDAVDGELKHTYKGSAFRPLCPSGVTCSHQGLLLALCSERHVKGIRQFNTKPPYWSQGTKDRLFEYPVAVTVCPTTRLWLVLEAGDQRCVNVLQEDGTRIRHFGQLHLKQPAGIAVDAMDRVYVTDSEKHCVFVFTLEGELLMTFGQRGSADGDLDSPVGVCVDPCNSVYVADQKNDRVSVFRTDGQFKFHLRPPRELHKPHALTLEEASGHIVVTSSYMSWSNITMYVLGNES